MDLSWLSDKRLVRPDRPVTAAPFCLESDGSKWAAVTQGHFLLAIRGENDLPPWAMNKADEQNAVLAQLFGPVTGESLPWAAFVAWAAKGSEADTICRDCKGTLREKCEECRGEKRVRCVCSECDDRHEAKCGECDGTGTTPCTCVDDGVIPAARVGKLRDSCINRAMFSWFLPLLPAAATVRVLVPATNREPVLFWSDSWRLLIMPYMANEGDSVEVLELPETVIENRV